MGEMSVAGQGAVGGVMFTVTALGVSAAGVFTLVAR